MTHNSQNIPPRSFTIPHHPSPSSTLPHHPSLPPHHPGTAQNRAKEAEVTHHNHSHPRTIHHLPPPSFTIPRYPLTTPEHLKTLQKKLNSHTGRAAGEKHCGIRLSQAQDFRHNYHKSFLRSYQWFQPNLKADCESLIKIN